MISKIIQNDYAAAAKLFQSCPTLCDRIDGTPPGSPIPGISQARALEWDAIALSKMIMSNFKIIPVRDSDYSIKLCQKMGAIL